MREQHFPKIQQMAEKVKFLRLHEGLSIRDLADEMSLNNNRIAKLETGEQRVDLQDVIRYCEFFGLSYEGFLMDTFEEFKKKYLADEKKMMKAGGYNV